MNEAAHSPTPRKMRRGAAAAGLLGAMLATTALAPLPALAQPAQPGLAVALPRATGPANFADQVARVAPAVVRVTVTGRAPVAQPAQLPPELRGSPLEEFFRRFGEGGATPAPQGPRRATGQGSGFVIDAGGHVVTNAHVVGQAASVEVELADGRKLPARVVGTDPQTDIALLKVEAGAPLPFVAWADSDGLRVGEWVLAMGNPFGLGGSATAGIVSARGRQIGAGPYDDFIQTDAPINPGSSGGPLFNPAGEVVGVNTAIFSPSGGNIGIGFAVPSNLAKRIVDELRDDGRVERGWLGVSLQPMDEELAGVLGAQGGTGVLIAAVEPNSPAARAGLRPGDIVTRVGGRTVEGARDVASAVAQAKPGTELALTALRNGQPTEQRVTLGEHPAMRAVADRGGDASRGGSLGLALAPRMGADGQAGATVARVEPGSVAERRGLRPGDVILRAADRAVTSPADVVEAVRMAREAGKAGIALQVERGEMRSFLALPLGTEAAGRTG
jgi:serine protease Do